MTVQTDAATGMHDRVVLGIHNSVSVILLVIKSPEKENKSQSLRAMVRTFATTIALYHLLCHSSRVLIETGWQKALYKLKLAKR